MALPSTLHHLALTVSDIARSAKFYDAVLLVLGYQKSWEKLRLHTWKGGGPEVLLYQAAPQQKSNIHRLYDPGIHHIAWRVNSRTIVDQVFLVAKECKALVPEALREYPEYAVGYYAVYFFDPDGIKLEVAHIPVEPS